MDCLSGQCSDHSSRARESGQANALTVDCNCEIFRTDSSENGYIYKIGFSLKQKRQAHNFDFLSAKGILTYSKNFDFFNDPGCGNWLGDKNMMSRSANSLLPLVLKI
eukprot:sb/3477687/